MPKLLTILGVTGRQGGSVAAAALKDGTYKVRGVTRNTSSAKARELAARGVEIVQGDMLDEKSLISAFEGSHAIFAVTDFWAALSQCLTFDDAWTASDTETRQGINFAYAASCTPTLEHLIWSSLPDLEGQSGGKYKVPHFASKTRIDAYIDKNDALKAKTTRIWVSWYAENMAMFINSPSLYEPSGKQIFLQPSGVDFALPSIGSVEANVGFFTQAILQQPQKTLGRTVLASIANNTWEHQLNEWFECSGTEAIIVRTSIEDYEKVFPVLGREAGLAMQAWDEIREKGWETGDGTPVLGAKDLGIEGARFMTDRQMYEKMVKEGRKTTSA